MENEGKNTVCRLCLKSCECTSEYVEASTIEMIKMLGLELNFNISGKPVICPACSANLQKCFEFKTKCLRTEARINSCRSGRNIVKLELRKLYVKKHENKTIAASDCLIVCRLCMEVPELAYISLYNETKGVTSAKTILEKCFSEIDLDIINNAVVCTSCNTSLHSYFSFVKNCSDIAGKIKHCSLSNDIPQEGSNVLPSATETLSYENDCTDVDICKNFNEKELHDGIKSKLENETQKKSQEMHVKREEVNDTEVEKLSSSLQFAKTNTLCCKSGCPDTNLLKKCYQSGQNSEIKCGHFMKSETSAEFNIKHEEINIKAEDGETSRFQDSIPKDISGVAEISTVHQCTVCKFETIYKHNLITHLLRHKDVSEIATHECEKCHFKTKWKCYLNKHMLIHKNDSEVRIYSCQLCTYKAKQRDRLKKHMLVHKSAAEVTMHQCDTCAYKSKYFSVLKRHMLSHRHASEVTMYHCETCTYKTKHQSDIKRHILIHKNTSDVTTYQCTLCTYKSKQKSDLRQHMVTHTNAPYSCDTCTYKAKRKARLRQHMLIHKNASEVTMYQCDVCTYKTRHQKVLHQHMAVHKDVTEVTTYICEICTYRTKRKANLQRHLLVHKK